MRERLIRGRDVRESILPRVLERMRGEIVSSVGDSGHWTGELSSSALSTATAVCALSIARQQGSNTVAEAEALIERGLNWLARGIRSDGGWGDTDRSLSNISTTLLAWAAFGAVPGADARFPEPVRRAEQWLRQRAGGIEPAQLVPAVCERYGKDQTFSVPILTMAALSGRLGPQKEAWRWVPQLPFELAALPARLFSWLNLPVVSYALPALIAIGQVRHNRLPSSRKIVRAVREAARGRTLKVLTRIQPSSGGFLEAVPLTSFVVMSLAAMGCADHAVARQGLRFLESSVRPDGSWAIDTNLATWITTLTVNALRGKARLWLGPERVRKLRRWLLNQQFRRIHPYTQAAPGGWAWTDLPGGVPDADDTAGALIALSCLGEIDTEVATAAANGVTWLLDLQNRDGGIPTFCRGWGALPFDRSGPDLTAHAVRAWLAWRDKLRPALRRRLHRGLNHALRFLIRCQHDEGSWAPLWFGNQFRPDELNPIYGTSRVLLALLECEDVSSEIRSAVRRGLLWLAAAQHRDGSWGGRNEGPGSLEETALAVEALAAAIPAARSFLDSGCAGAVEAAVDRGTAWLLERFEDGSWREPSPIGFYFAKLWYYEKHYPLCFLAAAFERVASPVS